VAGVSFFNCFDIKQLTIVEQGGIFMPFPSAFVTIEDDLASEIASLSAPVVLFRDYQDLSMCNLLIYNTIL
jgi:hypothetical protein